MKLGIQIVNSIVCVAYVNQDRLDASIQNTITPMSSISVPVEMFL